MSEPRQDSCDGHAGTQGWGQAAAQAGFPWTGTPAELISQVGGHLASLGWNQVSKGTTNSGGTSWSKKLTNDSAAFVSIFPEADSIGRRNTSLAFGNRAAELGVTRSFGSTGDCYDNAAVESLWATLKRDFNWIYGKQTWRSRDLLRSAIFDYIEGFYNPERIQKRLGYRSPADFESAAVA